MSIAVTSRRRCIGSVIRRVRLMTDPPEVRMTALLAAFARGLLRSGRRAAEVATWTVNRLNLIGYLLHSTEIPPPIYPT